MDNEDLNLNDVVNQFIINRMNPLKSEIKNMNLWLNNNLERTVSLFHGTSSKFQILKEGLLLNSSKNFNISLNNSLSFALNESSASNWGEMAHPKDEIITYQIRVKIKDLFPDKNQIKNNKHYYTSLIGNSLAESIAIGQGVAIKRNIKLDEIVDFKVTKSLPKEEVHLNKIVEQYENSLKKSPANSESKELSKDQNEDSTKSKVKKQR